MINRHTLVSTVTLKKIKQQLTKLTDFVLPYYCLLCNQLVNQVQPLCIKCEKELPLMVKACPQCARSMSNQHACGHCLRHAPAFDHTIALWHYQLPITYFISQLKYHQQLHMAKFLGLSLAQKLNLFYQTQALPELIIAIPLHKKRLQQRGFNQALEIAKPIARQLNIPLARHTVKRCKATRAQTELKADDRIRNVANAFALRKPVKAKHILLIDDVMTTGSTVNTCCQLLKKHGVQRIDVGICARADYSS